MKGKIKRLLKDKNCGFITGDDKKDYFFHESAVKNAQYAELNEGDAVEFEDGEGPKGPRAEEVYI